MAENIKIEVPNETLPLSDVVGISVSEIHPASWPGLINGVLRNLKSEASRAVINRIHKELADKGQFIKDTKENRDAGKTPTSNADALKLREAFRESNGPTYDAWMAEAEQALVATLKDGTFRVHEAGSPRVSSKSPEEARAEQIGRAEFDDKVLADAGYKIPKTKAGNRYAPNGKELAKVEVKNAAGEVVTYPIALSRYLAKHKERFSATAKKQLAAEARDAAKAAESGTAALDF